MPERLDRVVVQLSGKRTHVLTWAKREALLERLRRVAGGTRIVKAFEAVGASRPVELDELQRLALLGAISAWGLTNATGRSVDPIPDGMMRLRKALVHDLDLTARPKRTGPNKRLLDGAESD